MTRPLVVIEGEAHAFAAALGEMRRAGWEPHAQVVATAEDAERAVLAAVDGAAVVIHGTASRDVLDRLCDDLRRVGALEHRIVPSLPAVDLAEDERALLALLADGVPLGAASSQLHLSRRTADRRLSTARAKLGAPTTAAALAAARRRGLI